MDSSQVTKSLENSSSDIPVQQKILIASLLLMSHHGKRKTKEVTLGKLHETYNKVCQKRKLGRRDFSEVSSLCTLLDARGIVSVKKSKNMIQSKVSFRIDEGEAETAIQDKALLGEIISDTSCLA